MMRGRRQGATARAAGAFLVLLLAGAGLPPHAAGQEGVALASGGLEVEIVPSPEGLAFFFIDPAAGPVDASEIEGRVILRLPGGEAREMALERPRGDPRPNLLSCAADLAKADSFTAVLLWRREGLDHVLRFPSLSPHPPYRLDALPHDAVAHGHVTPHDGFVEVVGEDHAELVVRENRLRLFWFDVAMNQVPAAGVRAWCHLEPCGAGPARVLLRPAGGAQAPHYLEGEVPPSCATATRVALRIEKDGRSIAFRYRLEAPLGRRTRSLMGAVREGGYLLELRGAGPGAGYPEPGRFELRILEEESLAPVDLRAAPSVALILPGAGEVDLPAPLRLEAPGRWLLETCVPPGRRRSLEIGFQGLDGGEVRATLALPPGGWRRPVHSVWLVAVLAVGALAAAVVLLVGRSHAQRPGIELVSLLGLRPLLASRFYPAALPWLFLLPVATAWVLLVTGPPEWARSPAAGLLLGLLLPAMLLSPLLLGRLWCAACPFPLATDLARDLAGGGKRLPRLLVRGRYGLAALQVLLIPFLLLVAGLMASTRILAAVPAAYLLLAVGLSIVYGKRPFCRALCPVGAALGLFSHASPYSLEAGDCRCEEDTAAPERWSVLSASCCHCGHAAGDDPGREISIRLTKPFGSPVPAAGEVLLLALIGLTLMHFLARHPLWFWIRSWGPAGAALLGLLVLLPLGIGIVSRHVAVRLEGEPGRRRGGAWLALAIFSMAAWALPLLALTLRDAPSMMAGLFSGAGMETGPAAGAQDVVLAVQVGLVVTGAVLSALAAWRAAGLRAAAPRLAAIALVAAILVAVVATCFHLALPLAVA